MALSRTMSASLPRRRRWVVYPLIIALAAALSMIHSDPPARAEGVSDQVEAYFDDHDSHLGDGVRVPDIIATGPNDLVVAWREGYVQGQYDHGAIRYRYSSDGGQSWSEVKDLLEKDDVTGGTYVILYQVDSVIYAFLGRSQASSHNGMPVENIMKKSLDGGKTWEVHDAEFGDVPDSFVVAGRPLKYGNQHVVPFWKGGQVAVMRSTDMVHWTAGAYAPDPLNTRSGENQLMVSQDDPGTLIMYNRVTGAKQDYLNAGVYASRTTSTDGGLTWTPLQFDHEVPNMSTKGFVTKDSNGQYLAIYNTDGGLFPMDPEDRSTGFRSILNYKIKRPGEDWGSGRFLADGRPQRDYPHTAGWDTYAMADEYAPGKFFVVWEYDTTRVMVSRLDVSDAFTTINEGWDGIDAPWTATPAGGTAVAADGVLRLSNGASSTTSVAQPNAPDGGFVASAAGRLTTTSPMDPRTGVGANMAFGVSNGSRALSYSVQSDGVYATVSGQSDWQRVYTGGIGTTRHSYRVTVEQDGRARLYIDSLDTGAQWTVPESTVAKGSSTWVSGTAAAPAGAEIDWTSVEENVLSTTWDDTSGWQMLQQNGSAITTGGRLELTSTGSGTNGAYRSPSKFCDFSVDFRGEVTDYGTFDPTNGQGAALVVSAQNGSRRMMLSLQQDGVYSIRKNQSQWSRVYAIADAGRLASWRVDTNSSGEAHLFRNGADTGATWFIEDRSAGARVQVANSGRAGETTAAGVDWLRTTCDFR